MSTKDNHLPIISGPESSLFHDQRTGDYFTTYDAFFEHVLSEKFPVLAGKVHHESVSGKSLTWHERTLPRTDITEYKTSLDFHLELAVLFMVPFTPMRSLDALVNSLFGYLEERFMRNEPVLVFHANSWIPGKIVNVRLNRIHPENVILDGTRYPPSEFGYDVQLFSAEDEQIRTDVRCFDLRRGEGSFSRELLRCSLLQHCKCRKSGSVWCLKDKTVEFFNVDNVAWWDMFAGPEPRFSVPSKPTKHFPRQDKLDKHTMDRQKSKKDNKNLLMLGKTSKTLKDLGKGSSKKRQLEDDSQPSTSFKKKKYSLEFRKGLARSDASTSKAQTPEERRQKQKEYKKKWKEKLAKEREQLSKKWAQIFTVGEDLNQPNLKPIPVIPKRLCTDLPEQFIGDGLFVLEFLRTFGAKFEKPTHVSDLINWDLNNLHAAIASENIDGEFTRLLGFFAKAVMSCVPPNFMEADDPSSSIYRSGWEQLGLKIAQSTRVKLGLAFNRLPVSSSTISEITRMCLLVASLTLRLPGSTEAKSDGVILRFLQSQAGTTVYDVIYTHSVFALSFEQRMNLVVVFTQSVMESDFVRETLETLNSATDDSERSLRMLKSLTEEVSRICKAKIATTVAKDRPADKSSEKGDRFRQLLEAYARKRSELRSDKGRTTQALVDDIRVLGEGRRKRRLSDGDMLALTEALADLQKKFDTNIHDEKHQLSEAIFNRKLSVRMEQIGLDRHFFHYWHLPLYPGVLVERSSSSESKICSKGCLCEVINKEVQQEQTASSWWMISPEDQLILSKGLSLHGEREVALKRGLDQHVASKSVDGSPAKDLVSIMKDLPRPIPEISPDISWEDQILDKLRSSLIALEAKLQKTRLGGWNPPEDEKWIAKVNRPFGQPDEIEPEEKVELESGPPSSPEILAPPAEILEAVPPGLTNGHSHPEEPSACEPMELEDSAQREPEVPGLVELMKTSLENNGSEDKDDENGQSTHVVQAVPEPVVVETQTNKDLKRLIQRVGELVETVRLRYIGAPLVTIGEQSNKDASQLEHWKSSLQSCSSPSQINLHLHVFEHCILWNKAVVAGLCKQCRKKGEPENLVVCDGCDRIYHFYCVEPPVTEIPKEQWFCMICKPPPAVPRSRRVRHTVNYSEGVAPSQENVAVAPPVVSDPGRPKISDRAARALQRSHALYGDRDSVHSETSSAAFSADGDGTRRSARSKRVDYKELDGGPKDVPSRAESIEEDLTEEDLEYVNGDFHIENEIQSGSEDSEYDPQSSPQAQWGKKHKKHKVSRR